MNTISDCSTTFQSGTSKSNSRSADLHNSGFATIRLLDTRPILKATNDGCLTLQLLAQYTILAFGRSHTHSGLRTREKRIVRRRYEYHGTSVLHIVAAAANRFSPKLATGAVKRYIHCPSSLTCGPMKHILRVNRIYLSRRECRTKLYVPFA